MQVEGVAYLGQLMLLDLSHNQISELEVQQLPPSLVFLKARPFSTHAVSEYV